MPKITYVDHNQVSTTVEVANGKSVMQGAIDNDIEGIIAECGGSLACCTCHCMIDENWVEKTGKADSSEMMMLDMIDHVPTSRLSCQITVSDELDGLIVNIPEDQGF